MTVRIVTDILGVTGVGLIVLSYFLLQTGKLNNQDSRFSLANAAGSAFIIISLISNFNLSAFLIEAFWLLISLYGFYKNRFADAYRQHKSGTRSAIEDIVKSRL